VGLLQVVGQLGMGPVGPVQPLLDRPLDDPAADLLAQMSRDLRRSALGLSGPEAVEAPVEVGVEPALDGAGRDREVGGDVPVLAASMRQADDLQAIAGLAVGGLTEGQFEASGLVLGEMDADHGRVESLGRVDVPPLYTNRTASSGLCIRSWSPTSWMTTSSTILLSRKLTTVTPLTFATSRRRGGGGRLMVVSSRTIRVSDRPAGRLGSIPYGKSSAGVRGSRGRGVPRFGRRGERPLRPAVR
jgi:hypothetical protein